MDPRPGFRKKGNRIAVRPLVCPLVCPLVGLVAMFFFLSTLLTADGSAAAASETRMAALEDTVALLLRANHKLEGTVTELKATVGGLLAQQQEMSEQLNAFKGAQQHEALPQGMAVRVDATGAAHPRRLTETAYHHTTVGARAWQTHVFPEGHTCPNLDNGQVKQLLPVNNQSQVTWNPVPTDLPADANVSLMSVEGDWSTSEARAHRRVPSARVLP